MASALPLVDRDDNDIMKSVLFGLNADEKLPGAWKQWRWNGKKLLQPNSELQLFSPGTFCSQTGGSHYDGSTTDMTDEGSLIEWSTEPFHRSDRQQRNAFSYLLEATLVASRLAVILPYLHFAEMTPLDVVEVVVHYRYGCLPTYENRGPASSVSSNCKASLGVPKPGLH
ncbi:hypothetical protein WG66_004074 [Moniliophthora roreri]|nr:hypothetical protein WG66_004074 [Moniliophthora roreri]